MSELSRSIVLQQLINWQKYIENQLSLFQIKISKNPVEIKAGFEAIRIMLTNLIKQAELQEKEIAELKKESAAAAAALQKKLWFRIKKAVSSRASRRNKS